jgi:hypothetical protein
MIDKTDCSMSYVKIDDAIRIILKCGKGSKLCKLDISDAFKICPYKGNNKITELRTILQRESQNS